MITLLSRNDRHHPWAAAQSLHLSPPWKTCKAVLSEAFRLLGTRGRPALTALLRRAAVIPAFDLADDVERVMGLMQRYADVPMSLADACLVRMTETLTDPILFTTDATSASIAATAARLFLALRHIDR